MISFTFKKLSSLWSIKKEFQLKVLFLSLTFLSMSSCLVIWRPLKISLFAKMVGPTMVPAAKIYSLCILIPMILLYSKLVDWFRRHHLLYFFTLAHGIGGIIFFLILSHPVYGLGNTEATPARWIGWAFYFFMESFDAFFSTSFWSFADSVNSPKDANNYYGFFVSGSKIGGILAAGLLYIILSNSSLASHASLLTKALLMGSIMLFVAAFCVHLLIKKVPENVMHGYEVVYRREHERPQTPEAPTPLYKRIMLGAKSSLDGLFIMVRNPYVLGIFSLVVFYEVIIVIFDYITVIQASSTHQTVGELTAFYALYYLLMNLIGLVISFFGTTPLLRLLGIRFSLFLFPLVCLSLLVITAIFQSPLVLFVTLVCLRAFNYALNHPTREVLYIPTTKDIKFKAKTWTDAFGSRIAKTSGSIFNLAMNKLHPTVALISSLSLSLWLTSLWLVIIYFLGKKLQSAIDRNQIIGEEKNKN